MFHFLQKYKILLYSAILFLGVLLGWQIVTYPLTFSSLALQQPYPQSLENYVLEHTNAFPVIVILLFLLQVLCVFLFFRNSNYSEKNILFPIFWMLLFAFSAHYLSPTTPVFIINFIIILLLITNRYKEVSAYKNRALVSGILIGIASLYDLAAILLLFFIFAAIIINSSKIFKNILVLLLGFLTTYIYVFAYHFFSNDLVTYYSSFAQLSFQLPLLTATRFTTLQTIASAILLLLLPYLLIRIKIMFDNKLIVIRKSIISLHILLIVTLLMVIFTNLPFPQSVGYLTIPLVIYLSTLLQSEKLVLAYEVALTLAGAAFVILQI